MPVSYTHLDVYKRQGDVDEYGKEIYTTNKYFQYGAYSTAHVFEAQVGYDFGPLAVNWYTKDVYKRQIQGKMEGGIRSIVVYLRFSGIYDINQLIHVLLIKEDTAFLCNTSGL